jgi:hypothetical protein
MWLEWVRACGGNVFHTPAGLLVDAPRGTMLYGWLVDNATRETVGVTLGIRYGCRLSLGERHVRIPTLPALGSAIDPHHALDTLESQLDGMGIAEATIGSFDARYTPIGPQTTSDRWEYVVPLSSSRDPVESLTATHRRHVRRGAREGWVVRLLAGAEAEATILEVQQSTVERAAAQARGFAPVQSVRWAREVISSTPFPDYGLATFAAYRGARLLSSVLVGWAADRAFYLIGGSTAEGYHCSAAVWLHLQVIDTLIRHGIQAYNLGGTAADAEQASSAEHGLYRFKRGFGVSPGIRRGVRWVLRPGHLRLHRMLTPLRSS